MKYLVGCPIDNIDEGMYPMVLLNEISKDELLRCKRDDISIVNIENRTIFNHKKNTWDKIKTYSKYTDLWKGE
jgi:hypothetical protein